MSARPAVEVDPDGLSDRGASLDSQLTALLGAPISTTHDNRPLAWSLRPAREALTAQVGAEQVKAIDDLVFHPVVVDSDHGAKAVEQDQGKPFEWTGTSPEIDVHNFGRTTFERVRLTFSLAAPDSAPRRFTVHLPDARTQGGRLEWGIAHEVQVLIKAAPGRNAVSSRRTAGRDHQGAPVVRQGGLQDRLRQADQPLSASPGLPTWCESPCGSKVGFGLGPLDEVDTGLTDLGGGEVPTQLAPDVRDQG
jgi:hypothetical protein